MAGRRAFGHIFKCPNREGYYLRVEWRGVRCVRKGGATRKQAEAKLAAISVAVQGGKDIEDALQEASGKPSASSLSFTQAAPLFLEHARDDYKPSTFQTRIARLRVICRASWARKSLSQVKREDIERWRAARRKEGASVATINRDISAISRLYKWACSFGYAASNPVERLERYSEAGREKTLFLDVPEANALIHAADEAFKPLVVAGFHLGARRGEMLSLRWRHIGFEKREITFESATTKTRRTRTIPMSPPLQATLEAQYNSRKVITKDGEGPVFTVPGTGRVYTKHMARKALPRALRNCDGIAEDKKDQITFHTIRHSSATILRAAGVDIADIGRILGHSVLATTLRYSHAFSEETRPAIDRLGELLDGTDG
ncbi:MAG: site-specific integrase [Planctomycetota bacterium]|nr:site-specific integrase [Planctomycetota bacterium]